MTTRGDRLRAYLLSRDGRPGWQKRLVEKSSVKRQTISKYTKPDFDRYPDLDTLAQLAVGLEVPLYELIAAMDGAGPLLDLASAEAEAMILRVVERWARSRGLEGLDQGPGRRVPRG